MSPDGLPPYSTKRHRSHAERTPWGRRVMAFAAMNGLTQVQLSKLSGIPVSTLKACIYGDIEGTQKGVKFAIDAFIQRYQAEHPLEE